MSTSNECFLQFLQPIQRFYWLDSVWLQVIFDQALLKMGRKPKKKPSPVKEGDRGCIKTYLPASNSNSRTATIGTIPTRDNAQVPRSLLPWYVLIFISLSSWQICGYNKRASHPLNTIPFIWLIPECDICDIRVFSSAVIMQQTWIPVLYVRSKQMATSLDERGPNWMTIQQKR